VDLADRARFLGNPVRHLYAVRLRLHLEEDGAVLEEREPFELDGLERYGLEEALVTAGLAGRDPEAELQAARARGLLPHGGAGESAFGEVGEEVGAFLRELRPRLAGEPLEPLSFDRVLDTAAGRFVLAGRLAGLRSDGLLLHRPATIKVKDRLRLWVSHLALNLAAREGTPRASTLLGKDEVVALGPIEGPDALLADLLALYWEGLSRVVPFLPRSAWAYAAVRWGGGKDPSRSRALAQARKEWEGNDRRPGEGADPWFAHAFGETDPLGEEFEALAERVFRPLLEAAA
jgi:exodeoxyribonuclease V gamma subunit